MARVLLTAALGLVCLLVGASSSRAVPLADFDCVTNNNATRCGIGESQLSGSIDRVGSDARLTISVASGAPIVVEQIFIDSEVVTGANFVGGRGWVRFDLDARPADLLGGNTPGGSFVTATSFRADAPMRAISGIGPGETGIFELTLNGDSEQLAGDLKVGIRAVALGGGGLSLAASGGGLLGTAAEDRELSLLLDRPIGRESFVSSPSVSSLPVPEPHALVTFGLGALIVGVALRRKLFDA